MRLQFGQHVFDGSARRLSRAGRAVHLEPLAFGLLERRPAAVAKAAIHDRLWAGTFVSESSLTTLVAQLRKALGAEAGRIRTVRGFGYAFDGDAAELAAGASAADARDGPRHHLVWQERTIPLKPGANVLGRDTDAQVVVDAAGVSRRHARILVGGGVATVADLGSKNGTFVDGRRVEGETPLADRATLALGRTVLLYRCPRPLDSTETESPP